MTRILRCVTALAFTSSVCFAQCDDPCRSVKSGLILNEHWTIAQSPVCVVGDLIVSGLTIDPGVCVLMDEGVQIEVQSGLEAIGMPSAPITFTARDPDLRWRGLLFQDAPPNSTLRHCVVSRASDSGLRVINSGITIDHCRIENNIGLNGGGASIDLTTTDLTITETHFVSNGSVFLGGGLAATTGDRSLTIDGCDFVSNRTNLNGDTTNAEQGGAIRVVGNLQLRDSWIQGNEADGCDAIRNFRVPSKGGGVFVSNGVSIIQRTGIVGNTANSRCPGGSSDIPRGGGLHAVSSDVLVENCVIAGNVLIGATPEGGGIYANASDVALVHCTIVRNTGDGVHNRTPGLSIANSIVFFNDPLGGNLFGDQITGSVDAVTYSDVQNGWPGNGNINFNPNLGGSGLSFCDLTILPGSPCIDAGDPNTDPDCDAGVDPPAPPYGSARPDMGAHGGSLACDWTIIPCDTPANLTGDCRLDSQDFFLYLDLFAADDPRADLDGDGDTDADDFFSFLDSFAAGCPE